MSTENTPTAEKKGFYELVKDSDVPVLVDVYSDNCGPCIAMKPILTELKEKLGDKVRIIKIDGYKNHKFMQDYRIQAFPTLMIFKKGEVVWTKMGFTQTRELEKMVLEHA